MMRREGIYSSLLSTWRTQRNSAQRLALEPQKRGPKVNAMLAHTQGMAKLTRENDRLRRQLAHARVFQTCANIATTYHTHHKSQDNHNQKRHLPKTNR